MTVVSTTVSECRYGLRCRSVAAALKRQSKKKESSTPRKSDTEIYRTLCDLESGLLARLCCGVRSEISKTRRPVGMSLDASKAGPSCIDRQRRSGPMRIIRITERDVLPSTQKESGLPDSRDYR